MRGRAQVQALSPPRRVEGGLPSHEALSRCRIPHTLPGKRSKAPVLPPRFLFFVKRRNCVAAVDHGPAGLAAAESTHP